MNVTDVVGLDVDTGIARLNEAGIKYRIVRRDDKPYIVTADVQMARANLVIKNGVITEVRLG